LASLFQHPGAAGQRITPAKEDGPAGRRTFQRFAHGHVARKIAYYRPDSEAFADKELS
jgi:hypothetical protein